MGATKEKHLWMECIKIMSAFLVVMQHSISQEWRSTVGNGSLLANILNLIFMITRVSVPLFFMCSGAGMLHHEKSIKNIYLKNILGIVIPYVGWMLVYSCYDLFRLISSGEATLRVSVNVVLKNIIFGQYHTWFIITLIGLYIVTPFLHSIVQNETNMRYFIILSIIFTILLPYVGKIETLSRLNTVLDYFYMHFVVGYTLYFVMGHYLAHIKITTRIRILTTIFLPISLLLGWFISCNYAKVVGQDCQTVYSDFSIIGFTSNILFFLMFRIIFEKRTLSEKIKKGIIYVSQLGLGIYLLHPIFLTIVQNLHGYTVILGGISLWCGVLCIMIVVSKCPLLNTILLRIRK